MTDISKEAVDALIDHLRGMGEHEAPPVLEALLAALDEAEAREAAMLAANEINRETLLRHNADCDRRIRKADAERDAANALNERLAERLWFYSPAGYREIFGANAAHLGAKP